MAVHKRLPKEPSELSRRVRELETLIMLNQKIAMQVDLETLLQTIVDCARDLIGVHMGGLVVADPENPRQLRHFKVSGVPPARQLPSGHGLFMVPYHTGRAVRVNRVNPTMSSRQPPDHPKLGPFLAVPLKSGNTLLGSLFLAEVPGGRPFTQKDQDLLMAFAAQAAIAIDSAQTRDRLAWLLVLKERERISMSLHSSVAQTLFLLKMEIDRCRRALPQEYPELMERLTVMQELAENGLHSVKDAIFSLSELNPEPGLAAELSRMVDQFQKESGIEAKFLLHGNEADVSPAIRPVIRNVVDEALNNVRKHSQSPIVVVTLTVRSQEVLVAVQDAGVGLPDDFAHRVKASLSYGVRSMATLAQRAGGTFRIFTNDEGGTTVRVTLPNRIQP
ncbi:GAF sensor signal transduction histidine kinase [Sulfobacillus acidophilus TPY]|uniref:histidine kinase n=1 Tax=Sulfobacillus acidophilus (strain ATCC 700253 / DSM 10332 / NAL) TaxID=679936 RepID=G8TYR6_SULAD|nr:GAF sensor signal transduction histidine kinase [Sulfobacillus acidophilus TPY]AEW04031.1 putative signal transduction histidine kinase [Sulfobacillus acidophilus DSM 10332]